MVMMTSSEPPSLALPAFRPTTVLEDAKNYTVKHPLQFTWKLWFKDRVPDPSASQVGDSSASGGGSSSWQSALKSVDDICTVEDFWGWFNVMPKPTDIKHGGDIFLFHQGIEPSWEDPEHAKGSSLIWQLPRPPPGSTIAPSEYVDYWLNAMLACIGCVMPTGWQCVTGVQFSAREKGSRITLWLKVSDPDTITAVEAEFRQALGEGLPLNAQDIHFKYEEFAKQLAYQQNMSHHHHHPGGGSGGRGRGARFGASTPSSSGGSSSSGRSGTPSSFAPSGGRYFGR
jgi:translation initiation factor 4E